MLLMFGPHPLSRMGGPIAGGASRLARLSHLRRNPWRARRHMLPRDRNNSSFYIVVFFLILFACIITFEVLFIDNEEQMQRLTDSDEFPAAEHLEPQLRMVRELNDEERSFSDSLRDETQSPFLDIINSESRLPSTMDNWQPVTGTREKFYVYSAYFDGRRGRVIRIVAATRTRGSDKVLCKFWYNNGDPPVIVGGTNKVIRENWNLKYSAHFLMCPLFLYNVGRNINVPDEVSVLARPGDDPGNRLKVRNINTERSDPIDAFAVCIKPLHYEFNRVVQLVEFIEMNRLLGVEHFTFYNHTIGRDVACVLRQYIEEDVVTLLPWQLDMVSQKEIRTEGLFAALNDCLYRNMYQFRYLLMIDLDEYIVPHRNDSLKSMINGLTERVDPRKVGSFSFMNSFFYLQWPNDSSTESMSLPLVTLLKTRRRAKFHPHKQRSKCIVLPEYVIEMGNHFVWEFLPGRGTINVPPDVGFLHHYRVCEFGGSDCVKTQWVTDRTMFKYKKDILDRVSQRLASVTQACGVTV